MTPIPDVDPDVIGALASLGAGVGIKYLLSLHQGAVVSPDNPVMMLLARKTSTSADVYISDELRMLDRALDVLSRNANGQSDWCQARARVAWSSVDHYHAARGALSELEAFGTILDVFSQCVPVPKTSEETPDFVIPDDAFSVEVYRPRESETNRAKVKEDLANQSRDVKIAISHPLTGSAGLAFPANQIVNRILNAKRDSQQVYADLPAVLYVDVRHEWHLGGDDLLPYRTVFSKGQDWIGTLGAWHAFYGKTGRRTMLRDRTSLRFLADSDAYEQERNGFFRTSTRWSAALLAVRDGLVIFENPWATHPLAAQSLRQLLLLHRVRAEYCWYRAQSQQEQLATRVELMLSEIEWVFRG
jgi:hypothetical protein